MHEQSPARRLCHAAALIGAVLFFGMLVEFIVDRSLASLRSAKPGVQLPLVGTWLGENGNVLNLRSDGTGRARLTTNPQFKSRYPSVGIDYFEWKQADFA